MANTCFEVPAGAAIGRSVIEEREPQQQRDQAAADCAQEKNCGRRIPSAAMSPDRPVGTA